MNGLFPDRQSTLSGMGAAAVLAVLITPVHVLLLNPLVREALSGSGNTLLELQYPATFFGCFALLLWSASFEMMFFSAGAMSFLCRLTGHQWVALALCVAFRVWVASQQLQAVGLFATATPFLATAGLSTACCCFLFAQGGLLPAMAFGAAITLHHFVRLLAHTLAGGG
jgi:hypothetical protein